MSALVGVAVALALAAAGGGPANAAARGCHDRIEGSVPPPNEHDTRIGPIAFTDLPASYRYSSRHPRTPMKSIAILRAGRRVSLTIPRNQRSWLSIGYAGGPGNATLQACRHLRSRRARRRECRWGRMSACANGPTLFSGGFGVKFRRAPQRGRCAELIVRVRGREQPLREYLFDPAPGDCA